ncbi:protein CutA homolog [Hypomesus transpacificus]|uniref:protein CutA homolog n=1 Tax=Hypomesus transpacificus TaxID=137520 RepID=UPI001F07E6E5|nr:protein CutA homolog [Hypomesus transpacificus]
MTLAGSSNKTDWFCPRCHKESVFQSVLRSGLFVICLVVVLSMYPLLRPLGVHIHSAITGSYIPGHHSVLLVNCPNEQAAKDIGRAIMERRMAASINILPRTSTMYYWKGDIQDATEILMMVMTRTSNILQLTEYVRSVHPYEIPEILSFPVDGGSLAYLKWMDEAMPDD